MLYFTFEWYIRSENDFAATQLEYLIDLRNLFIGSKQL
jgi:hypothetical protein